MDAMDLYTIYRGEARIRDAEIERLRVVRERLAAAAAADGGEQRPHARRRPAHARRQGGAAGRGVHLRSA